MVFKIQNFNLKFPTKSFSSQPNILSSLADDVIQSGGQCRREQFQMRHFEGPPDLLVTAVVERVQVEAECTREKDRVLKMDILISLVFSFVIFDSSFIDVKILCF